MLVFQRQLCPECHLLPFSINEDISFVCYGDPIVAQKVNESLFLTIIWLKGEENLELCKSLPCSFTLFPSAILWP